MRRFTGRMFLVVLFLGCASTMWAQEDARKEDHEKLRALKAKVAEAFNKQDAQGIAACFTKEFAVTTIDQTTLSSSAEIEKYFNKVFKSSDALVTDLKISPEADILTRFVDADNGYCYGKNHEIYTMKKGGVKAPIDSRWTAVVHRENGEWKIVAIHAGVNFIDNPVLARSEMNSRVMAGAGFASGAVLALVFAFFRRKKANG